ncbi:MAG: hypothetical protein JKX70_08075 [Phycisphaerales bacterium]|nr:hypothetical protein [Phycisphaerales bacterium]
MSHKIMIASTILLSSHLLTANATAGIDDWIGTIGDWNNPANWADGSSAGASDLALIANGGTAIIDHQNLILGSAIFGMDFEGRFGDGGLIQRGGITQWDGFGGLIFGRDTNTTGSLTLTDGASLTSAILELGYQGNANAIIEGGSQVTVSNFYVAGRNRSSDRTFTAQTDLQIRGQGTLVQVTRDNVESFMMGTNGSATVTISDDAVVEAVNGLLASTTAQGSSLTIDGPGSTMRVTGQFFDTGRDITLPNDHPDVGNATLTLRNGGTLDAQSTSRGMIFAEQSLTQGTGNILGDVRLRRGVIDPGELNTFGHLTIAGQLDNEVSGFGGTLHFDLGGTDINLFDRLTVNDLLAGGTLEVALIDGYNPELYDSFDIITTLNSITGDFDLITLPQLTNGFFFESSIHATGVTLTVVPVPSSMLVFGCFGILRRRRRTI